MSQKHNDFSKFFALWVIRLRPSFGTIFGLILLTGVFVGFSIELLLIALGLALIHLFGDLYNDVHDYEIDLLNKRTDKLTTLGFFSFRTYQIIAASVMLLGLYTLYLISLEFLVIGVIYAMLLVGYSHPKLRLKELHLPYYLMLSSLFIVLTFAFIKMYPEHPVLFAVGAYAFLEYAYVLCQKDSTDKKDKKNLFLGFGRKNASRITALFGFSSTAMLAMLSLLNPFLVYCVGSQRRSLHLRSPIFYLDLLIHYSKPKNCS